MARINGKNQPAADGKSIADYINETGYRINNIAVECNGTIVSKADYEARILTAEDVVEVVTFVGGG